MKIVEKIKYNMKNYTMDEQKIPLPNFILGYLENNHILDIL